MANDLAITLWPEIVTPLGGRSSVGRASASQSWQCYENQALSYDEPALAFLQNRGVADVGWHLSGDPLAGLCAHPAVAL